MRTHALIDNGDDAGLATVINLGLPTADWVVVGVRSSTGVRVKKLVSHRSDHVVWPVGASTRILKRIFSAILDEGREQDRERTAPIPYKVRSPW